MTWKKEKLFSSGDDFFAEIFQAIDTAEKSIDFEIYIFEYDSLGKEVAARLIQASSRGVKVRVLVDGIGSSSSSFTLQEVFQNSNVEFRVYHPLLSYHSLSNLNRRNHRKTLIVDGKLAFVGDFNVSNNHLKSISGDKAWRDFGLSVEGVSTHLLTEAFLRAWNDNISDYLKRPFIRRSSSVGKSLEFIQLNDTLGKRHFLHRNLIRKIKKTESRVWLANAYFVPRLNLIRSLCLAARRGVDVRVLVPKNSDIFFIPWLTATFYLTLLKSKVKVYEYLPTVYHAKVQVLDDIFIVGSSNLNYRTLLHDLEVDLQLTFSQNKVLLEEELKKDFNSSQLVSFQSLQKSSFFYRMVGKILLLFKYWF